MTKTAAVTGNKKKKNCKRPWYKGWRDAYSVMKWKVTEENNNLISPYTTKFVS